MSQGEANAAWSGWTDQAWDDLRTLEGMGMALVPLCPANHQDLYAGCPKPGKVPAGLPAAGSPHTIHRGEWA